MVRFCGQMLGLAGEILKLNGQVFGQLVDSSQPSRTFRSRTKEQAILRLDPVSGDLLLGILLSCQIRIFLNITCFPCFAVLDDWTSQTKRRFPVANGGSELHHRLVVISRSTAIEELVCQGSKFLLGGGSILEAFVFCEKAGQYADNVSIADCFRLPEGYAGHGRRNVRTDPGSACQDSASSGIVFQESTCLANL